MHNQLNDQDQKYLPTHLLDDDDVPTNTSLKNGIDPQKQFAFSAPPILFNLSYRIEEDFFDEVIKPWGNTNYSSPQKLGMEQKSGEREFELQVNNTRKLSLQNQQEYLSYQSYQNINTPPVNFFPIYSPQQQILNNLSYVQDWCKDQYGSRNVQTALQNGNDYLKNRIFQSLSMGFGQLVYDKFGNYVIQKYLQIGSAKHKQIIYDFVKKELLFISLHGYGCRVVQKIVEFAYEKVDIQVEIMKLLEPHILQVIMNQNGNHIVQRVLEIFSREATQNLSKLILLHLQKLSFHSFGCRVVQKYLQNGRNQIIRSQMMDQLIKLTTHLSKCQYGNYIMQYIVSKTGHGEQNIFTILQDNLVDLSCNKFASNVIQKAIKSNQIKFSDVAVDKILHSHDFVTLSKNQFGNYVVQSLLERCSKERKQLLKNKLKDNCQQISKSQYGRHVLMQMEKFK